MLSFCDCEYMWTDDERVFGLKLLCLETYRCNSVSFCITFVVVGPVFVHVKNYLEYCIVIVIQLDRHLCTILLVACLYS